MLGGLQPGSGPYSDESRLAIRTALLSIEPQPISAIAVAATDKDAAPAALSSTRRSALRTKATGRDSPNAPGMTAPETPVALAKKRPLRSATKRSKNKTADVGTPKRVRLSAPKTAAERREEEAEAKRLATPQRVQRTPANKKRPSPLKPCVGFGGQIGTAQGRAGFFVRWRPRKLRLTLLFRRCAVV